LAADIAAFMKTTAAILLMCVLGVCGLQGCAVVRQPSPSMEATADSPGGIRVMGPITASRMFPSAVWRGELGICEVVNLSPSSLFRVAVPTGRSARALW